MSTMRENKSNNERLNKLHIPLSGEKNALLLAAAIIRRRFYNLRDIRS